MKTIDSEMGFIILILVLISVAILNIYPYRDGNNKLYRMKTIPHIKKRFKVNGIAHDITMLFTYYITIEK